MDFNQLRYFIEISKAGNISKAAERLNISQPPLSNSLKSLENELNVQLILRNTRNLELTECGEFLFQRGEYILELIENTKNELRDLSDGKSGTLSIGTVSYALSEILPKTLKEFSKDYPNIKYSLQDMDSTEIISLVKKNQLDLGIIRTPFNTNDLEYFILPTSPYIFLGNSIPFSREKPISLLDIKEMPLLLQKNLANTLSNFYKDNGLTPNIRCVSNDVRSIISLTEEGLGYSIIPKDSLSLVHSKSLEYVDIEEGEINVGTAIILSKNSFHSKATKNFINKIMKPL
ncbi:MAG: LysR family transcriptional regulator [Clostridium sp.]